MTARPPLPGLPLSPEHARLFDALIATLTVEEALWISGYLAGFARLSPQPQPAAATSGAPAPLLILYGSETGHAAALADQAEALARTRGLEPRCLDMADFKLQELKDIRHLLVLTSTHGDGDPPTAAADFCEFVLGRKAPRLPGLKFAVLGLGDSSYERFCQTGKDLDHRLEVLGAERLHPRLDCDVEYEGPAAAWLDAALEAFAQAMGAAAPSPATTPALAVAPAPAVAATRFDATHPFPATVLDNINLNGRGSGKETRHIELSVAGSGFAWEPGDSLGVLPENDPVLVEELIAVLALPPDTLVPDGEGDVPLAEALAHRYEITTLTPGFIQRYGEAADAPSLRSLADPERQSELRRYLAGRQIIDVVSEFPVPGLGARDFVAMLRHQQPRLYSLASSPAAYPEEAHLTVSVVRYESHERARRGLASGWLAGLGADATVPVHLSVNKNFRLPADPAAPIIMVGAGTGVAPFRAFLQHREALGAGGRNWLFFGDRRFRTDFLYQTEWQRYLKDGRLTRMDVAFSRDQAEKLYVQHRLLAQGREMHAWLQEGAHFYLCGDASRLAPDVHGALVDIAMREGSLGREDAEAWLKSLQKEKRYQRDVY